MATFTVTTLDDEADAGATPEAPGGAGLSLREAVALANALSGADTIDFADGLAGTVRLTRGEIDVTDEVVIDGGGAITLSGDSLGNDVLDANGFTDVGASFAVINDNTRILDIDSAVAPTTLRDISLTGGVTTANNAAGSGGAVRAFSRLTLERVNVVGNSTRGDFAEGGGVFGFDVRMTDSAVVGNVTRGFEADGGGVSGLSIRMTNTTVARNLTTGPAADGGGLFGDDLRLTNVTVTGNSAQEPFGDGARGGGVFSTRSLELNDSIVLGNRAASSAPRVTDEAVVPASGGFFSANGTVILGSSAAQVQIGDPDIASLAPATVFAVTAPVAGQVVGGVAAFNGGPVLTVALAPDPFNEAIDGSAGPAIPALDARGVAAVNVTGVGAESGALVRDLGAFELAAAPAGLVVTTGLDVVDPFDDVVSLREALAFNFDQGGGGTITFAESAGTLVRLTLGSLISSRAFTLDGGGTVTITGDADADDVLVNGLTDVALSQVGEDRLDDNLQLFQIGVADVTFTGLTLTGGRTTPGAFDGGAISAGGAVTVTDSVVAGNSTRGGAADGGAIFTFGPVIVAGSTFSGNRTEGREADGGAVFSFADVSISNSTFSGNSTGGEDSDGGAVATRGRLSAVNSTFVGNVAARGSGGAGSSTTIDLRNVTATGNRTLDGAGAAFGAFAAGSGVIADSLLLGNVSAATGPGDDEVPAGLTFAGVNLVGADAAAFDASTHPAAANADPALVFASVSGGAGALADNGGPVATVALNLSALNPALDASAGAAIPPADARGTAAADQFGLGAAAGAGLRDLGAFEAEVFLTPPPPPAGPTPGPDRLVGTGRAERIAARGGDDTVRGRGGEDTLLGQGGDDILVGQAGADVLRGGGGADTLRGGGGADRLFGQGGGDLLQGGAGGDFLNGGGGGDTLVGGPGDDTMTGGRGADVFQVKPGDGTDEILRFQNGLDTVAFTRRVSAFEELTLTQEGEDVRVAYARGTLLFRDRDVADFSADDFTF